MAAELIGGPVTVTLSTDDDGWRTYRVKWLVETLVTDGPYTVYLCPNLPLPGSVWRFYHPLGGGETDIWAWCRLAMNIAPHRYDEGEPVRYWTVEQTFSNKPPTARTCKEETFDDPLLEPQKVSLSWSNDKEEGTYDRFGRRIVNSAHEQIRGPQNEWDVARWRVTVEQNVVNLQLPLVSSMRNCVNAVVLWGMPIRTIKLADFTAEPKWRGGCYPYWTRKFTFDVRDESFDRDLLDEGSKVLSGHWQPGRTGLWILDNINGQPPNPQNPNHFIRFKDYDGNPARVVLNKGLPAGARVSSVNQTVVASVALTAATTELTVLTFTGNRRLVVSIADADRSIVSGYVRLFGYDAQGRGVFENVEVGPGSANYVTTTTFSQLSNAAADPALRNYFAEFTGTGSGDAISVTTAEDTPQAGYVRVEKYNYADFALLGIPLTIA